MSDNDLLSRIDLAADRRREAIRTTKDSDFPVLRSFYVSNDGDDRNDGRSPASPWKTLSQVCSADLLPGDGVFFRRGDLFRGSVLTRPGVTYAAYGIGEKPKIYGWDKSLADPALWESVDDARHIWKYREPILDCGTLVFNDGEFHGRKLIPSYINGRFVCRDDESTPFRMAEAMTRDLDLVCFYRERMTEVPTHGQDFPVPQIDSESYGELYLRCDRGNPGAVFSSVEALPHRNLFRVKEGPVTVDNLCLKYTGSHAVGAAGACIEGLCVTNCEIGWIGGSVQNYLGNDPNYPQGGRGTVTRYGNGVEIYGGCDDYQVRNCYIYQVYDAGITHQYTVRDTPCRMSRIRYTGNLVEHCVYSIEYFLETDAADRESIMEDIEISDNILRCSGYGWGQQRHNKETPAHIKGWSYVNPARNFRIFGNVFDRAAYRMLHLVAYQPESLPILHNNTYLQSSAGRLGQYGPNVEREPENLSFSEESIRTGFGDRDGEVFTV